MDIFEMVGRVDPMRGVMLAYMRTPAGLRTCEKIAYVNRFLTVPLYERKYRSDIAMAVLWSDRAFRDFVLSELMRRNRDDYER